MMKITLRVILVMVLVAQPVYAYRGPSEEALILLLGGFALLVLLGIIFLGLIITSTVFLIQRRSTPARRKYGKVAEILSYILMFLLPLFGFGMLIAYSSLQRDALTTVLIACAIAIVPGGLSAFLAHKVKKLPAENSEG